MANFHPRFGLLAAIKSLRNIKAGENNFFKTLIYILFHKCQLFVYISGQEILCHYDLQFHEAHPWYQEMWRTEVEYDTPEGPYGHR